MKKPMSLLVICLCSVLVAGAASVSGEQHPTQGAADNKGKSPKPPSPNLSTELRVYDAPPEFPSPTPTQQITGDHVVTSGNASYTSYTDGVGGLICQLQTSTDGTSTQFLLNFAKATHPRRGMLYTFPAPISQIPSSCLLYNLGSIPPEGTTYLEDTYLWIGRFPAPTSVTTVGTTYYCGLNSEQVGPGAFRVNGSGISCSSSLAVTVLALGANGDGASSGAKYRVTDYSAYVGEGNNIGAFMYSCTNTSTGWCPVALFKMNLYWEITVK
jgi:hypothetical protein